MAGGRGSSDEETPDVGVRDYLGIVRARVRVLLTVVIIAVGAAIGVNLFMTPMYTSRAVVYFTVPSTANNTGLNRGLTYAEAIVRSYAQSVREAGVLDKVISKLALPVTRDDLAGRVTALSPLGTVIIEVRVKDSSPTRSAAIANAIAQEITNSATELGMHEQVGEDAVQVVSVAAAGIPTSPSAPKTRLNLALSLIIGSLTGFVLCVWLETLDPGIRSVASAEGFDTPAFGYLPLRDGPGRGLARRWYDEVEEELQLTKVHSTFRAVCESRSARTVLFVCPLLAGQSFRAVSIFGARLIRDGVSTVIVDADLRRRRSGAARGGESRASGLTTIASPVGLSSVLRGEQRWEDVLVRRPGMPPTIPAGPGVEDPNGLLESTAMTELLAELAGRYDRVLLHVAPVLAYGDGVALAGSVDLVILVGDRRAPRRRDLLAAVRTLTAARAPVRALLLSA